MSPKLAAMLRTPPARDREPPPLPAEVDTGDEVLVKWVVVQARHGGVYSVPAWQVAPHEKVKEGTSSKWTPALVISSSAFQIAVQYSSTLGGGGGGAREGGHLGA